MDHHIAAYIDAYMGDALDIGSHGLFKEHEITGTRIVLADITAQGVKPIGTQPANIAQTGVIEYPADEARAIKADVGTEAPEMFLSGANAFFDAFATV